MMDKATFNNSGDALTIQADGVEYPAEYTLSCINDFVHSPETGFEDLQNLCLGLVTEVEKLRRAMTNGYL